MKRSLLAVATVGAAVAVLAACQSHNSPTDPTKSEAVQAVDAQNGQVSATATVPGGPGSVPVPGGPGSVPVPGGPGSGVSTPTPTPTPGTTPTPTTSPTPTPTATPEPTPTPVPCSGRFTYSNDTPATQPTGSSVTMSKIDTVALAPGCRMIGFTISLWLTSDVDLSTYAAEKVQVRYNWDGGSGRMALIDTDIVDPLLTGTQLGSSCADLSFRDGVPDDLAAAPAPYVGTFMPAAPLALPDAETGGTFLLKTDFSVGGNLTLQCWEVAFTASPEG